MAVQGGTTTNSRRQAFAQARLGNVARRGTAALAKTGMRRQAETDEDWHWRSPADGAGQEPEATAVQGKTGTDGNRQACAQARLGTVAM